MKIGHEQNLARLRMHSLRFLPLLLSLLLTVSCTRVQEPPVATPPVHVLTTDDPVVLDESQKKRMHLSMAQVAVKTVPIVIESTGTVRNNPNMSTSVISLLPGRIEQVWAQLGDPVKKGEKLAEIRSDEVGQIQSDLLNQLLDLEAERKQAELKETFASKQYERKKVLLESKIAARVEVEEAENMLEQAKAEVHATDDKRRAYIASSKERLKLYGVPEGVIDEVERTKQIQFRFNITAPRTGVVAARDCDQGELVQSGKALFVISDTSHIWVVANVLEDQLRFVRKGLPATVSVESLPGETFHGLIDFIDAAVDDHTRTLGVRATISNEKFRLKPEMFARLSIQTGSATALTVPSQAIQKIGDSTVVYLEEKPGSFRERKITIGRNLGSDYEVLSGLKAGDRVVVHGSLQLLGEELQRLSK